MGNKFRPESISQSKPNRGSKMNTKIPVNLSKIKVKTLRTGSQFIKAKGYLEKKQSDQDEEVRMGEATTSSQDHSQATPAEATKEEPNLKSYVDP
jgi:hypothetical protein